ncbi:hypothetical protein Q5752_006779 [Cryptotrichosporon argae]
MPAAGWYAQQLLPPALLTYFAWAWRRCTYDVGHAYLVKTLGYRCLGTAYTALPTLLVGPIAIIFSRLYLLPRAQAVPPALPPRRLLRRETIFEVPAPASGELTYVAPLDDGALDVLGDAVLDTVDGGLGGGAGRQGSKGADDYEALERAVDDGLVERCFRGTCRGRWKPARARHCSECGTCRVGFDHHCAFFANCLTAPNLPPFMALLLLTPITTTFLSLPLYRPLLARARDAYRASTTADAWWWASTWTWIVPAGPVGRHIGGAVLGWRALDAADPRMRAPEAVDRLEMAVLVGLATVLGLITLGLAASSLGLIRRGELTVDRARAKSYARALAAAGGSLRAPQTPQAVRAPRAPRTERADRAARADHADQAGSVHAAPALPFSPVRWFYVPLSLSTPTRRGGVMVPSRADERPYDLGARNWALLLPGRWWLPWARGMRLEAALEWPIRDEVRDRLVEEAAAFAERRAEGER